MSEGEPEETQRDKVLRLADEMAVALSEYAVQLGYPTLPFTLPGKATTEPMLEFLEANAPKLTPAIPAPELPE